MLDVLVVDDEDATRMSVASALAEAGHHVTEAEDGEAALALIQDHVFDVAICDVRLPKLDGISLFRRLRLESPGTAVVLMTAYATVPDAVACLREGAFDYVTKPFDVEEFSLRVIGRIAERRSLRQELEHARSRLATRDVGAELVGASPVMVRLIDRVHTLAHSDSPVLIIGESGTGKELVARTLHARSARRGRRFVAVDCAAFPHLEEELFGYDHAAFPGAMTRREGRFQAAEGGTLFLDEVDEIPLPAQASLLAAMSRGMLAPQPRPSQPAAKAGVRIISATRHDLRERIRAGAFRDDLFYRLNVLDIRIPPLRERRADLPLLVQYFLQRFTPAGKVPPGISPRAWALLSRYPFPGNVRELAHALERAVVLAHGSEIDVGHLPEDIVRQTPATASDGEPPPLGKGS
jgi:DNA-binding NtrC family response regulator